MLISSKFKDVLASLTIIAIIVIDIIVYGLTFAECDIESMNACGIATFFAGIISLFGSIIVIPLSILTIVYFARKKTYVTLADRFMLVLAVVALGIWVGLLFVPYVLYQ